MDHETASPAPMQIGLLYVLLPQVYRDAAILCHMLTPDETLGARGSRDSMLGPLPFRHVGPSLRGSVPAPVQ